MTKLVLRLLTWAFALIGVATVALWLLPRMTRAQPDPIALTFTSAPDGWFKAATATWAESFGAVSSYCYTRVFVAAEAVPTKKVTEDENLVFEEKRCGSLTPRDGQRLDSPVVFWRTPRVLVVRFSILAAALVPATFQLRRQAASGEVAVEYEIGQ